MQDMHVISTVLGLGGRLVAGCDGLLPDTQSFIFRLPFSLVNHTAINLLRDGREGEIMKGCISKNRKNHIWMAGMLLFVPVQVQATETLKPLVVTAGRIAQDPAQVSADVTVIDRKAIIQSQKTLVADILRSQPGIDVAASGGPGKATSVFLRGANSGQTLVLIDGVRVGSATLGSFDWANLSTADVERIEIVRGPQSSLYGADAMGGVIQIFTRKGKGKPHVRVYGEAGTYHTVSGGASVSGATDSGVSYALTTDSSRTRSVSAATGGSESDPYRQVTVSGRLGIPVGDGNLDISLRNVDGKTGLDGFGPSDALNFTSDVKQTVGNIKFLYPLGELLDTSLQVSRSTDESINHDPAVSSNNSDFRTRIDQITWQNTLGWRSLTLLAGLDFHWDRGLSGSAKIDQTIIQRAGFAALSWDGDWANLSASVRNDQNSASRNKTTYHVGGVLRPLDGLKLTANYGTGFKAPSINDLFFPGFGNPNLAPEQSKGWDTGVHYRIQGKEFSGGFNAVWFDQRFTNLIQTVLVSPPFTFAPLNAGKARTNGLELSTKIAYGPVYANANWTFLHAVNSIDGTRLARRAKDSGSFIAGARIMGVNAEVQVDVIGPRFSTAGNKKSLQGYHKTDIRVSYQVDNIWTMHARVDNLENKKYEEVAGFGVLGQAFYGGVSAEL